MRKKTGEIGEKRPAMLVITLTLLALCDGRTLNSLSPNRDVSQLISMGRGGLAAAGMVMLFMGSLQRSAVSSQQSAVSGQ
jgi:hypothetical protein